MRKRKTLHHVTIVGYASQGKGLAHQEGKVLFVPYTVKGDVVDVQLIKSKKDWMEGRVIHWHSKSSIREAALCHYFGDCGGCKWQMLPYTEQLLIKQEEVISHLSHIGKLDDMPELLPIVGCEMPYYYRNKMEFSFSSRTYHTAATDQEEQLQSGALGLHVPGRFDKVLPIKRCHTMHDTHNHIRNTIARIASEISLSFYDVYQHTGMLRSLQIRCSVSGEWMVWVIFGGQDINIETINAFLECVHQHLPILSTIAYGINNKQNDSLHDIAAHIYCGKGYIVEQLGSVSFEIDPKSFFQTNTYQAHRLYQVIARFAELRPQDILYDIYCGVGSIGIFLAHSVRKVVGIEVIPEAIQKAAANSQRNQISHAHWICADATLAIDYSFLATYGMPDCIVVNPPRAGLSAAFVEKLLQIKCRKIIYVSCNTATQARDVNLLRTCYRVEKMQAVDMFPQTHHIENVILLALTS